MSTYLEGANHVGSQEVGQVLLPIGLSENFPEVAQVFRGDFNQETGFWKIPPASITLFVEGGRLKFVVNPGGFGQVCFGTVKDASKGLEGVNSALQVGDCEWKRRGGHKRS
jgi:hypothetical protein